MEVEYGDASKCCERNKLERLVVWWIKDAATGPEQNGWTIIFGMHGDYGVNVDFCPFCGTRLTAMQDKEG